MDEKGIWHYSPSYDLTFSSGPAGEHSTMVMGEGKNPKISHLFKLAEVGAIEKDVATQIVSEVKEAVFKWPSFADRAKVSKTSSKMIEGELKKL